MTNRCAELEKNTDLDREKANSLRERQCDIIAYLSRQVEIKNNEIIDLDNTISTLKTASTRTKKNIQVVDRKNFCRYFRRNIFCNNYLFLPLENVTKYNIIIT